MIIAMTGATGLLGTHLIPRLQARGHPVKRLVRGAALESGDIQWDPRGSFDTKSLEGVNAVIHFAGENIGQRWNPQIKARILESRRQGTRTLSEALASLATPPQVLVSASAVGYYGDRGNEILTEESGAGQG